VLTRELVPGDVVLLRTGDVAPADLRLIRAEALAFDRSVLTGIAAGAGSVEPDPEGAGLPNATRLPTRVRRGRGRGEGVVVATGLTTSRAHLAGARRPRAPPFAASTRDGPSGPDLAGGGDRADRHRGNAGLLAREPGRQERAGRSLGGDRGHPEEPPALVAVVLGLGAYRLLRMKVSSGVSRQETLARST